MDESLIYQIYDKCVAFRKAIERTPKKLLSIRFQKFPRGSCLDASSILGIYLERAGFGTFFYICGERNHDDFFESHAWLEKDELLVDITGDQFLCRPPVYVGDKDYFYTRFRVRPQDRHLCTDSLPDQLLEDYAKIHSYL